MGIPEGEVRFMKIYLDANIVLDVLLKREPFYPDSLAVLDFCESGRHEGWISIISVANISYIGSKLIGKREVLKVITILTEYLLVTGGEMHTVKSAIESGFEDFEDALQHASAIEINGMEVIITRNTKDFKNSLLPVLTPVEFLKAGF